MHYIGIDIGGTKIAGGIVTTEGVLVARQERSTPIRGGGPSILTEAIEIARALINSSRGEIRAIGIGAAGQIDTTTGHVYSATDIIPQWQGIAITEGFNNTLGLPSAVDNDVNVLALAESRFGAARQISKGTVVFLALGTGVGGAVLVDGAILHGSHWCGGELGHILLTMDPDARRDLGGAQGTLEAYCSGSGMVQTWLEMTGGTDTSATGHDVVNDAIANPGGPGSRAIAKTGEYLGFGLVSLANALDPEIIIIGGGVSDLGEALLEPARKVLRERALPGPATCPVVTAQLGSNAAIVGAASLVMGL
jgi:glucokinase